MPQRIGVACIQGDFEKHLEALGAVSGVTPVEVRTPDELSTVDRLILPGGESTTVGLLMQRFGLADAICDRVREGMAIWGTCMGLIMLAKEVEGRPEQFTLGVLDVTVRRNAFGAQVHSFEDKLEVIGFESPIEAVFIRAPEITRCGEGVVELARYESRLVAVRQGNVVGTSFHPELTSDRRMHAWFAKL